MQRFLTSFALILALGLSAETATALGFGNVASAPTLGQPLNFVIGLRLDPSESLEARCVKAAIHFGDHLLPESQIRSRIETFAATGERRIRIVTTVPVDEPLVNLQLQVGCPPTLSRNFLVFADPPGRAAVAESNVPAEGGWADPRSPVSDVLAAVPPTAAAASGPARQRSARNTPPGNATRPSRTELATAPAAVPDAAPPIPRRARPPQAAKAPPRGGPVLRLDPIETDALITPSLQMATTLSMPASPAASGAVPRYVDPEQEQRLRDQERLKGMESALVKLRGDSESTQKSLNEMQLRVKAAEAARYANPLVYLLTGLCALLAVAFAAMWWLRRRDKRQAVWWTGPEAGASPPEPNVDAVSAPVLPVEKAAVEPSTSVSPAHPKALEPMFAPPTEPPPLPRAVAPETRPQDLDSLVSDQRRPMSAEELIDLEQQAEFFVVLGQDDAAIDLLMGHVRSTGGVSPLPYMKLLEIYRRRGERDAHDRIRERFNRRFNAYASEWDVDPDSGLSLDGYPEVMERLQKSWGTPSRAMELLDTALFRRDAGPTFDVPAYRELLFLYGIARDLAERDVDVSGVDLLLPIGDEAPSTLSSIVASEPQAFEPASFSLDLDVSSDILPLSMGEDELNLDGFNKSDIKKSGVKKTGE